MKHAVKSCASSSWCVSCITGSDISGAILSVFHVYEFPERKGWDRYKYRYGEHNGRRFETTDDAFAFALAHGYCQLYYSYTTDRPRILSRHQARIYRELCNKRISFSKKARNKAEIWR